MSGFEAIAIGKRVEQILASGQPCMGVITEIDLSDDGSRPVRVIVSLDCGCCVISVPVSEIIQAQSRAVH